MQGSSAFHPYYDGEEGGARTTTNNVISAPRFVSIFKPNISQSVPTFNEVTFYKSGNIKNDRQVFNYSDTVRFNDPLIKSQANIILTHSRFILTSLSNFVHLITVGLAIYVE